MIGNFALAYIIFFVADSVLFSIFGRYIKKNVASFFIIALFLIALGIITTYFEPFRRADLYRQFLQIKYLHGVPFSEFSKDLFNNTMWGENIIYWLFSHFNSLKWYPFVFTVLTVGMAIWLTIKPYHEAVPVGVFTVAMMVFFAGNSLTSIFGGVRNRFVNGVIILCLYKIIEGQERKIPYLLIMLLVCFIHISGIITLLIVTLALILRGKKKLIFVILPMFYSTIIKILSGIGNSSVQFFVLKMKYYFEESYTISFKIQLGYFLLLLFIFLILQSISKTEQTKCEYKYYSIVEGLVLFGGGMLVCPSYYVKTNRTLLLCNSSFIWKNSS